MRRIMFAAAMAVMVSVFVAAAARADGMLIYHGEQGRDAQPFSVKYHRVKVNIKDQVARTSVDQVFRSKVNSRIEATYLFPLPEKSAITNFSMKMNGNMVEGKVMEKDEARRIYEDIVRKMKDPALLEYAGRDLFKARVFPIEPLGEAQIGIDYNEVTSANGETYRYKYPLSTERFSRDPIENVSVTVNIETTAPLKNIYSPSHNISVRRVGEKEAVVSYEVNGTRPNTDFELYYSVSRDDIGVSILTYKEKNEDGYFMLMASPRVDVDEDEVRPKDVLFVVDRTGSMSGEKIEQARAALKFCLRSLNKKDRFNVVTFNESPDPLFERLVAADRDNIDKAVKVAENLSALGGTNIDGALEKSLPMASDPSRPAYILFLTDGLPTVGVTDIQKILENATKNVPRHIRLFVFGVGYDVNTHLLDQLSSGNKGMSVYVKPGEDLEVKVSDLFRMISSPVLTDVALEMSGAGAYDVVPLKMADIFKGGQLIVTGRYRNAKVADAGISGTADGKKKKFVIEKNFDSDDTNRFLPTLWASRRIGVLLDEIRLHGQKQELVDEVVRLSKKYGIITEYTSFLVTEPAAPGKDFHLLSAESGVRMKKAAAEQTGGYAVSQSAVNSALQNNINVTADIADMFNADERGGRVSVTGQVQNAGNKAFYLNNGVWTDSGYDPKNTNVIKIQNFSPAMFSLLEKFPELGTFFAQGESVLVVGPGGVVIQTAADGKTSLTPEELSHIVSFK